MLKAVIKKILFSFYYKYFKYKFFSAIQNIGTKKLYIFDLDNTIANTWISYNQSYSSHKSRLDSLSIFIGMKKFISNIDKNNSIVIILTAREYWYYSLTKKWIESNELNINELIVVSKPYEKILLLKEVMINCEYYDDMSYNHENNHIIFYENEIKAIKSFSNISYYNYDDIKKINGVK